MAEGTLSFEELMKDSDGGMAAAMRAGQEYLRAHTTGELLHAVGHVAAAVPAAHFPDKRFFQKSYGREVTETPEDLMVGKGLFYLTEQRQVFLDCTGGHYQMIWGYEHPELMALLQDGIARGIVWDDHSNIPSAPVKRLAEKLVEIANPSADMATLSTDGERLNTVLTGCATGTVACAGGMKICLRVYEETKTEKGAPVFITLDGNYHGSDFFAQYLRGMWPDYFQNVISVRVQPNAPEELDAVFAEYGERVAAFWAEPVMMNREAIPLTPEYLQHVRAKCTEAGALMCIDEIQTGFWFPEIMMFHQFGIEPDVVILGKGMTAGFHPLAAVVFKGKYDILEQYDAISTNGNAALPSYMALGNLELIARNREHIGSIGTYYHSQMAGLAEEFPGIIAQVRGAGHMSGLKFHNVEHAMAFHRAAIGAGLWLRVHAYHEGHSTILTKFALPFDREVADWALARYREILTDLR